MVWCLNAVLSKGKKKRKCIWPLWGVCVKHFLFFLIALFLCHRKWDRRCVVAKKMYEWKSQNPSEPSSFLPLCVLFVCCWLRCILRCSDTDIESMNDLKKLRNTWKKKKRIIIGILSLSQNFWNLYRLSKWHFVSTKLIFPVLILFILNQSACLFVLYDSRII